jgi:D-glycero-D-manno-heptose 1,7-bisphosphate phosphatase
VVVTNQGGVAHGYYTEAAVNDIHRHLSQVVQAGGARIDAYYYCPHHPHGSIEAYAVSCDCRKPATGLAAQAARELGIDPTQSFVVGDKWKDIGLARGIGARGILVRTGYGASQEGQPKAGLAADAVVDNLAEAVSWILLKC